MNKYPDFFLKGSSSQQRKYEALRAFHVENLTTEVIAAKFGYSPDYFNKLKSQFHKQLAKGETPLFFSEKLSGAPIRKCNDEIIQLILQLRNQNMSVPDIQVILSSKGNFISTRWIDMVLKSKNLSRLEKRSKVEALNIQVPVKIKPEKSEAINIETLIGKTYRTIDGGIFYFWPLLAKLKVHKIIEDAGYPETSVLSRFNLFFSILALKLMDKERLSHAHSLSFDAGLGLFSLVNSLPKDTSLSTYSYNVTREMNLKFLKLLSQKVNKVVPFSGEINLDFTTIPHWGDKSILEKNWSGNKHKSIKGVLALLAQDSESGVLCYGDAEVKKKSSKCEVLQFIDFWRDGQKQDLKCLIFDSKFTTLENLKKIDQENIKFITIRQRHPNIVSEYKGENKKRWTPVTIDKVKRKHKKLLVNDTKITIDLYDKKKKIRQLVIKNNGREEPTFILTNDFEASTKHIITKYAKRWLVEKGISESISFFHLNLLSSSIVIKVDFDLTMTILAHTLYKLLAMQLSGFENQTARSLYLNFIHNGADIEIHEKEIHIKLLKKSHNPIIMSSNIFQEQTVIPWLDGFKLRFSTQNTA